jgi:tape measure domain-containing protein
VADSRNTIRWDSVGADKVKRDFADVTAANDKAAAGFQRTGASASSAATGVDRMGRAARDYAAHANVANTASRGLQIGLGTLAKYASAAALLEMGRRTLVAADAYNVLQGRIREATRTTGDYAVVSQKLFSIAQTTGTALENNVALFQRMASGAREFGASNDQILQVTKTIQQLGIIGGASAASMAAGTTQFAQAMAAGIVRAEEWNSVVENMPEVAVGIADALGKSVGEIRQMVIDGKLLSKDVFGALQKQTEDVQKRFDALPVSIERAGQKLSDAWGAAAAGTDAVHGTTTAIVEGMERLADILPDIVSGVNEIVQGILNAADWVDRGLGLSNSGNIEKAAAQLNLAKQKRPGVTIDGEGIRGTLGVLNPLRAIDIANAEQAYSDALVNAAKDAMNDASKAIGRLSLEKPNFGAGGSDLSGAKIVDKKAMEAAAKAAEKAAKQVEDWQNRIASGWIELYDRVNDASTDFYTKLQDDINDAIREEDDAQRERRKIVEDMITDLQTETAMIGLSNKEREKRIKLMAAEKAGATPDQLKRLGLKIDANQVKQAAQDAADEVKAVWDNARDDFSDAWSDMFTDIFDGGKFSFKKFTDSLKNMWARLLGDLLTLSLKGSFIDPLFDSLTGGISGGGARTRDALAKVTEGSGSKSSPLDSLGADMKKSLFDPIRKGLDDIFGEGFSKDMGNVLGGAAMGAGLGGMVGSSTGGAIGGALGQMFGPIGGLVGGLIGGLVGSLFKSTPRSISSITTVGSTAGIGDSYASGLDIKIGQNAAKTVANALNEFARSIDLSLDSDAFIGMIGQRGKKFFFQSQQSDIKKAGKGKYGAVKFDDAESAIAAAIEAALENGIIDGLSDVDMKLLRAASDVQEGMQKVIGRREFMKELDFQYMGITDPLGEQLARLKDWYQEQLKLAEEYEVDKTKLDALYADKRKNLIEQYNEQLYGGLKDFLTSITAGSASTLSPTTRLGLAQANYNELAAKAKAGDENAIGALQGAAADYLNAGRDVFASAGGYQSIYQQVVADLSSITGSTNPLTGATNNVAAAVNDNMRTQITLLSTAQTQRETTNSLLRQNLTLQEQIAASLARMGISSPTQNGVVQVGYPNVAVNW